MIVAKTAEAYRKTYERLSNEKSSLDDSYCGECSSIIIKGGKLRLLIYAKDVQSLVHELSHAVFFIFDHCGVHASNTNTEPFCYYIDHLFGEIVKRGKIKLP
tara:strand:+ start:115 stop:420 length:306 start_codon:yes stop_codon:yes gene_type:complete